MRAVNLLPAERRKGAKGERTKPQLTKLHGIGLGLLVGAVALGYWGNSIGGVAAESKAQADTLESEAQAMQSQIAAEKAKNTTQPTMSSFQADKALVTGLASARVNWGTVMVNLSRVAPEGVWLEKMAVTTPSATAAPTTGAAAAERPAAITLTAHSLTRTSAALFISRLDAIPGFDKPRLQGGINPRGGESGAASIGFDFSVEIPVDDAVFGPNRTRAAGSAGAAATPAPAGQPATVPSTPTPTN